MRIEAIGAIKSGGYVVQDGDMVTVPDEIGALWCQCGWARDVAGVVPTGKRRVLNAKLDVDNASANAGVQEV